MDYLQNALQNNRKSDDFFDLAAKPKRNTIKMPIGKTDRSFDLEIDDDVMSEILKDRQRDLLAEQNLQREKLKKIQEENEYNAFFGLNKAADRQKKREEDIFSLPKAEYDALFAPPKTTAPQRNYPNILQKDWRSTQQNSAPSYAVNREPNIWKSTQNNINDFSNNNQNFKLLSSNDKIKNSGYGNDTKKQNYDPYITKDARPEPPIIYNEGRGYPNKSNPHPSEKQGKKRILVVTAEGINSKKEDGKREPAWDVLRKQLESYGDFEVDMPQDLSFYDYDGPYWLDKILNLSLITPINNSSFDEFLRKGENVLETFSKGIVPLSDKDARNNVKAINNYINSKVGDGNIGDYYDGMDIAEEQKVLMQWQQFCQNNII